ncbi:MAG: hypothetical protein Kow0074_01970 [Candidatus Zixiibacteriota bacterium]
MRSEWSSRLGQWCLLAAMIVAVIPCNAAARPLESGRPQGTPYDRSMKPATAFPIYEYRLHSVGQVWFTLTNFGLFGIGASSNPLPLKDRQPLGIDYSPGFHFPAGTRNEYMYAGSIWLGGIVGTDTLVSVQMLSNSTEIAEWNSYDTVTEVSTLRSSPYYDPDAKAPQQYFARLSDTLVLGNVDALDARQHRPLNVEISQRSYAWSDLFSRQFVIVEYWVRNFGTRPISKMTFGIFMDADVYNDEVTAGFDGAQDDISGFLLDAPSLLVEDVNDYVNIAWVADNDGDPIAGSFPRLSPRGVVGVRIIHSPPVEDLSFNWWLLAAANSLNWGPSRIGSRTPAIGGGQGGPEGDRNTYYVMTNGERDYGQMFTAVDQTEAGWRPAPRSGACDIANGLDTRQVISVGPTIDPLMPGDSVPFVIAMVGGANFHTNPRLQFDCDEPQKTLASLSFDDLVFSATWASWIYDAPGYDSDGDGYRGEYHLVNCDSSSDGIQYGCDTLYYTGDLGPPPGPGHPRSVGPPNTGGGAPDFAGPEPPPCPPVEIETRPTEIIVRWSGRESETTPDPLTRKPDFEQYRLYIARTNTEAQYSLLASWDRIDYNIYAYDTISNSFVRDGFPLTPAEIEARFGVGFDPDDYPLPETTPNLIDCYQDSVFDEAGTFVGTRCVYFAPEGFNQENEYTDEYGNRVTNLIQKLGDSTTVNDDGDTLTFGFYEARLTNLNPSIGQYVSVTSWDYGNPAQRLAPAESGGGPGALGCVEYAIPIYNSGVVADSGLQVSVFPNPYKIRFDGPDGRKTSYFEQGFEAPQKFGTASGIDEQDRRIWFINLPDTATITIYTLDGDLVRTIRHVNPAYRAEGSDPNLSDYSSRTAWDLVTRNAQAAVSGIYIWRVESRLGTQVGKLVIIK